MQTVERRSAQWKIARNLIVVTGLLAITSCQSAPPRQATPPRQTAPYMLTSDDIAAIKRDLPSSLKDPNSAMFGTMGSSIDTKGVVSVCGYVNARNSFGGYTGQQPYTGILATNREGKRVFAVSGVGDGHYGSMAIFALCQRNGITL